MWDVRAAAEEWTAAGDALELAADFAVLLGGPAVTLPLLERYETVPEPALTRSLRTLGGRLRAFRAVAAGEEDMAADAFAEAPPRRGAWVARFTPPTRWPTTACGSSVAAARTRQSHCCGRRATCSSAWDPHAASSGSTRCARGQRPKETVVA
jgi:hypothetical protein